MNEEQALRLLVTTVIIGFIAALIPRRRKPRATSGDESGDGTVNVGRRSWCPRWPRSQKGGSEGTARPHVGGGTQETGDHQSRIGGDQTTLERGGEATGRPTVGDGGAEDILTGVGQVLHESVALSERRAIIGTVERLDGIEELRGRKDA